MNEPRTVMIESGYTFNPTFNTSIMANAFESAKQLTEEGMILYNQSNFKEALDRFQAALEKVKQDPDLFNLIAQSHAHLKQWEKAVESIDKAIALTSDVPLNYHLKATFLMRMNRPDEAIPIIDKTIELQKSDIAYILRGQASYNLNNLKEACTYFDKALDIDPKNPLANHMKGLTLFQQEKYGEAIPHLEQVLQNIVNDELINILAQCKELSNE